MPYLLHQLLTNSAKRYPSRDAVLYKDQSITYSALEHQSTHLANALKKNGVRRGDRVGIYLNKGIESIVAAFGIMKASAVYVPLDPSAPVRRLAYIMGNCGMRGLISTGRRVSKLGPALPESSPLTCVVLTDDTDADQRPHSQATNGAGGEVPHRPSADEGPLSQATVVRWRDILGGPSEPAQPAPLIEDDLAYILYTSGSTGEPKGVMISHRASLTFVDWACDCIKIRPTDRVSNHAPLHFDLSTFDIFAAVKAGATVVLVPEELSVFPYDLANFIEGQRITVWYSVPSVLTRLVLHGELQRHRFSNLSKILFAGEVFPVKYLRQLKSLVPHAEYYNLYGPTETNVCTYYVVKDLPADDTEPLPIGRACANTEVFAVTDRQEIARPGELGELYVRGPSLMKGYWGVPEKTREVLVRYALPGLPWEEEVYRTGDLVKEDPHGNYLFLGRRDNMIKSRGYRIELGEIESVLYTHPKVQEVAVVAIPDEQIGNVIKAVVVPRDSSELTRGELERYCSERIPKYMVPGIVEFRHSLPKTSTGKADKALLLREQLAGSEATAVKGA